MDDYFVNRSLAKQRIASKLSPLAALFFFKKPQLTHLWIIAYSPFLNSTLIGIIIPWQTAALSPGEMSTCLDQRHFGQ